MLHPRVRSIFTVLVVPVLAGAACVLDLSPRDPEEGGGSTGWEFSSSSHSTGISSSATDPSTSTGRTSTSAAETSATTGSASTAGGSEECTEFTGATGSHASGSSGATADPGSSDETATDSTGATCDGVVASSDDTGPDPVVADFILGADISSVHERNDTFRDTDGEIKSIFELLKNHGFNYLRVKTFVDPMAPYGYASNFNGCIGFTEPFSDKDHVIAFGKQIKDADMGFLLNFHYSDVWADPGNQLIPQAWRGSETIDELAEHVRAYTADVVTTAIAAGARPDMVQIGNEITPGMLMHVPGPHTDCWGNYPVPAPLGGAAGNANWPNLAALLIAGIEAVRAVDPSIKVMLHLENTDDPAGIRWWLGNALSLGVDFDVLGLSCYTTYQGEPTVWESTFEGLARDYPDLEFVIAEYNPARTEANLMIRNLHGGRGLGTFFWEPTRSGSWGASMFHPEDGILVANEADFAEFDALRPQLGL